MLISTFGARFGVDDSGIAKYYGLCKRHSRKKIATAFAAVVQSAFFVITRFA